MLRRLVICFDVRNHVHIFSYRLVANSWNESWGDKGKNINLEVHVHVHVLVYRVS